MELNVQIDHVHLLVKVPPKLSISALMGVLKGRTAIRLFITVKRITGDLQEIDVAAAKIDLKRVRPSESGLKMTGL